MDGADFTVGAVQRPVKVDDDRKEHGSIVGNNSTGNSAGWLSTGATCPMRNFAGLPGDA